MHDSIPPLAIHPKMTAYVPTPSLEATPAPEAFSHNVELLEILEILRQGERFVVCSHSRPDGDAVGSMLAMGMLLEQMGKHADLVSADQIPEIHRGLPGVEEIRIQQRVQGSYDAVILLECDCLERTSLRGLEQYFLVNIDHHATGRIYANVNWIDRDAASTGALIFQLVKAAGAMVTPEMATCLYTTVLTDTGGFCYGATQASTFGLAQELAMAGADPLSIARNVYFSMPVSRMLLLGVALGTLKQEGPLAWLWVTREDIARTGAAEENCEGIVNFALCVAGVEVAVFLYELPEDQIQLSLRSKGKANVALIATQLGGGGHRNSAGCILEGPLERALEEILMVLRPSVAAWAGEAAG
jgi:phosphoesterase RecJ-like protein